MMTAVMFVALVPLFKKNYLLAQLLSLLLLIKRALPSVQPEALHS